MNKIRPEELKFLSNYMSDLHGIRTIFCHPDWIEEIEKISTPRSGYEFQINSIEIKAADWMDKYVYLKDEFMRNPDRIPDDAYTQMIDDPNNAPEWAHYFELVIPKKVPKLFMMQSKSVVFTGTGFEFNREIRAPYYEK